MEEIQKENIMELGTADGVLLLKLFREENRLRIIANSYDNRNNNALLPFEELVKCWQVLGESIFERYEELASQGSDIYFRLDILDDVLAILANVSNTSSRIIKEYKQLADKTL